MWPKHVGGKYTVLSILTNATHYSDCILRGVTFLTYMRQCGGWNSADGKITCLALFMRSLHKMNM
jgi:hypothetical protein